MIIFNFYYVFHIELIQERITFGREGDCNISNFIEPQKVNEISSIHFSIVKKYTNDPMCPAFIGVYIDIIKICFIFHLYLKLSYEFSICIGLILKWNIFPTMEE